MLFVWFLNVDQEASWQNPQAESKSERQRLRTKRNRSGSRKPIATLERIRLTMPWNASLMKKPDRFENRKKVRDEPDWKHRAGQPLLQIISQPFKEQVPHLALGGFGAVFDFGPGNSTMTTLFGFHSPSRTSCVPGLVRYRPPNRRVSPFGLSS